MNKHWWYDKKGERTILIDKEMDMIRESATDIVQPETQQIKQKQCSKCLETKPLTEFSPKEGGKHRVMGYCKRCRTQQRHIDRVKAGLPINKHLRKKRGFEPIETPGKTKTCPQCRKIQPLSAFLHEKSLVCKKCLPNV